MRIRLVWTLTALLSAMAFPAQAKTLHVVASFSIIGDMAKNVAGDAAEVRTLVAADNDVHSYEPTPADVKELARADLLIINGLGLEGWLERLARSSGYRGAIVIASEGIAPLTAGKTERMEDPHGWQNLANAAIYITNIRDALIQADPQHRDLYTANADHYLRRIEALEAWVKQEIASVPAERRKVVTSHASFRYFAQAYGIVFLAPLSASGLSDSSAASMARLIDQLRAEKASAVFLENVTDPRLVRQLERDGKARMGGTLYSDALSGKEGPASTYLDMFRHNVSQLTNAMRGSSQSE